MNLKLLKGFSQINNGIVLKAGSRISTISNEGHIYAESNELGSFDFGIYDIGSFLATLSLTSDTREIGVDGVVMKIKDGKTKLSYTGAHESQITTPPEDVSPLTSLDRLNKFDMSSADIKTLLQACSIMHADTINFTFTDGEVCIHTSSDNPDANTYNTTIPCESDENVTASITRDSLKLIDDDYTVFFTSKAIVFESDLVTYYIVRSDM